MAGGAGKSWAAALLLSIFLGPLGVDRLYLGYVGVGVLKLLTCGGLGLWWLVDVVLLLANGLPDAEGRPLRA
jgi:TM2 domain-containing membrane protein YozV